MFTLVIPVAGRSSRFPDMRPKWLLTMPNGKLMVEEAIEGIDLDVFDRIVLICLKEHLDEYVDKELLLDSFKKNFNKDVEIIPLETPTSSQAETIKMGLLKGKIEGAFFIKDCDNKFSISPVPMNVIASVDLNKVDLIDAKNKSYVEYDSLGYISNIVEKEVISNSFCCGGYGFSDASDFISSYNSINKDDKEIYISHVIYNMLLNGEIFRNINASQYIDWGTLREYRHFCKKFLTVFCDVDGVIAENGGKFSKKGWKTKAIERNVRFLKKLKDEGRLYLILTSSRPETEIQDTLNELLKFGLNVDHTLFGLPHSARYLINDYSSTNPYPSAVAINLKRDIDELDDYFGF